MTKIETVTTSQVCEILGFHVSIAQIKALNIEPVMENKVGANWEKARVWQIARRLGGNLTYLSAQLHHAEMIKQGEPELPF